MKTTKQKTQAKSIIKDIGRLYQNESIIRLFNDLTAIGTWPTPEKPKFIIPL